MEIRPECPPDAAREARIGKALLNWYDHAARVLPWRVGPAERAAGRRADPYRVWLSEVMLQQTLVAAATGYFNRFTALWPTVADLAAAPEDQVMAEWAGLGYYARARNLMACARAVVAQHGGSFPADRDTLLTLPGIGPYTAAAIAAIAFDRPATVVDGNVERVISRLFAVSAPFPLSRPVIADLAARLTPANRPGDHAQAMMDLGATICIPKAPRCVPCPLTADCAAHAAGIAAQLPRKAPRPEKPRRQGIAYVARQADGSVLLERRPARGLLGGTLGWPTSDWTIGAPTPAPPFGADWAEAGERVEHSFTHFHLTLTVLTAPAPPGVNPDRGQFLPPCPDKLPTLMRKVHQSAFREAEARTRR